VVVAAPLCLAGWYFLGADVRFFLGVAAGLAMCNENGWILGTLWG